MKRRLFRKRRRFPFWATGAVVVLGIGLGASLLPKSTLRPPPGEQAGSEVRPETEMRGQAAMPKGLSTDFIDRRPGSSGDETQHRPAILRTSREAADGVGVGVQGPGAVAPAAVPDVRRPPLAGAGADPASRTPGSEAPGDRNAQSQSPGGSAPQGQESSAPVGQSELATRDHEKSPTPSAGDAYATAAPVLAEGDTLHLPRPVPRGEMAINETETAAAIGPRGGPDNAAGGTDFVLRSDDGTARRTPAPSMEGASVRPNAGNAAKVVRAILTSSVREREPVDTLAPGERVSSAQGLYFFTELRDLAGRSVEHRWMYGDRVISSARYGVGSDRWRLYSKKPAAPTLKGPWQAVVVDSQGDVLAAASFTVE